MTRLVSAIIGISVLITAMLGGVAAAQRNDQSATDARTPTYAALGDSVAAGLGLASDDTRCGTSAIAYPTEVAQAKNLSLIHVACGGATIGDLFTEQRMDGPNPDPQLDATFASGTPQLITITGGANDVHWDEFVRKCLVGTCGTRTDNRIAGFYLWWLELKLDYLFYDIERRSDGTPPAVVLTGYYNPFSEACAAADPRLASTEIRWLTSQLHRLNQTLAREAEQRSYAQFVPLDFTGHDICSSSPWIQGLQDPAPLHPTVRGQQEITRAVLRATE